MDMKKALEKVQRDAAKIGITAKVLSTAAGLEDNYISGTLSRARKNPDYTPRMKAVRAVLAAYQKLSAERFSGAAPTVLPPPKAKTLTHAQAATALIDLAELITTRCRRLRINVVMVERALGVKRGYVYSTRYRASQPGYKARGTAAIDTMNLLVMELDRIEAAMKVAAKVPPTPPVMQCIYESDDPAPAPAQAELNFTPQELKDEAEVMKLTPKGESVLETALRQELADRVAKMDVRGLNRTLHMLLSWESEGQ